MSLWSFSAKKDSATVIFDVQSSLVRAAVVTYDQSGKPHHWYSVSQNIPRKSHADSTYLTKIMLHAIESISMRIAHDGVKSIEQANGRKFSIDEVHFVLSSPWAISHSKTVRTSYSKETEITKSMITSIIDSQESSLRDELTSSDSKEIGESIDVIEKKIFEVKLNGYPVSTFEGRRAHTLEVSCAVTMSSHRLVRHIQSALAHALHPKKTEFHSALLLHYTALRGMLNARDEYISIHVHGELTDIVVVKKGMCSSISSYPFGSVTLVRKVAGSLQQTESIADSTLEMYSAGKLHDGEHTRVEQSVSAIISGWSSLLYKSILSSNDREMVPRTVILSCHSHYPIFERVLSGSEEWPINVSPFDESLVEHATAFEKLAEHSPLMGMYSVALSQDSRAIL